MIKSRNESSHTYNVETANALIHAILDLSISEFQLLSETMTNKADKE